MAARSSWAGAISLGGFPIPVKAYSLTKSASGQSFKTLCGCHQEPIVAPKVCAVTGEVPDVTYKGHEVSKGNVVMIPDDAAEQVRSAEKSSTLEIQQLAPRASVPTHLASAQYRIVPDDKVPGSEQPVQILWNGLYATDRVLVTEWTPRAGSRDSILAIYADEYGLTAVAIPYMSMLADTPEFKPVQDQKQADMFTAFANQQGIDMGEFAHSMHESSYEKRREAAITAALNGTSIPVPDAAPAESTTDLMAAMSAALDGAKTPAPKKRTTKPKEATKA